MLAKIAGLRDMKEQIAEIVAAYVRRNAIPADQLPILIATVSHVLSGLGKEAAAEPASPAVPIRQSVRPDRITCLECGWAGQMLKRHIVTAHALTVPQYRGRWNLASYYPLVAPNYAKRRSELAKSLGLGTHGGGRRAKPETPTRAKRQSRAARARA
jgi:predicted transcriptional regulator